MYHYIECGLKNVWLINGYHIHKTSYGEGISIEDVDGLHRIIAKCLVHNKPTLTGTEFRFLRKELGLSQAKLALILGNDAQSVALWEKRGRVPKWADHMMRAICREKIEGNAQFIEIIERLNDMDRTNYHKLMFEQHNGWEPKAA